MSGRVLIICHGSGRGRHPGHIQQVVNDASKDSPELRGAIRVHATGSGKLPGLRNVRSVLFWLADPLREMYPDCFAEAAEIARRARAEDIHLANPPEALSNSIKSVQAAIWGKTGIPTPPHRRFETRAELDEIAGELSYPVIIKSDMLHSQSRMRICRSAQEIRALPADQVATPGSVVGLVNTRAGYRDTRPGTIWARFFHKKRVMVLGDVIHPRHTIFSTIPIVGIKTSTFGPFCSKPPPPLLPGDTVTHACVAADNAYWTGEPEQPDLMRAACRALGFATAAIDYATFADGRVVLWEANPYFFLFSAESYPLPKERRFEDRYRAFHADFQRFLQSLLEPPSPT